MKKLNLGLASLSAKALAVIAAVFGTAVSNDAHAQQVTPGPDQPDDKQINYEQFQQKVLKPKLVLKVNLSNPDNSLLALHSSHSSHRSHSSHSSHSSHYSGSSYSPSYTPSYTPSYSSPSQSTQSTGTTTTTIAPPTDTATLGERVLHKGCKGTDVTQLQKLLVARNYKLIVTGNFGDQTEAAVKKFQTNHGITADGIVNAKTLQLIQKK